MHSTLLLIGVIKVVFGLLVGVAGVLLASRVMIRLLKLGNTDEALKQGNTAVAILQASGMISLGILGQRTVTTSFSALDLMAQGNTFDGVILGKFAGYALAHLVISLTIGAIAMAVGAIVFNRMTPGIDEVEEIKKANIGAAIVLSAVIVVMALLAAPGLQTALDGLLPLPVLGRDEGVMPS